MTERSWHPDDTDELTTQRLPRVEPPLPGSLDPVRRPAADEAPEAESTAELSIDDLMGPARPVAAAPPVAVPPPPPPVPARPVPPTPATPATPAAPAAPPTAHPATHATPRPATPAGPSVTDRMRSDAAAAWSAGVRRGRTWLDTGDNAVIAATTFVAVLLLVMVAVL